jgi:hypothetical protein
VTQACHMSPPCLVGLFPTLSRCVQCMLGVDSSPDPTYLFRVLLQLPLLLSCSCYDCCCQVQLVLMLIRVLAQQRLPL